MHVHTHTHTHTHTRHYQVIGHKTAPLRRSVAMSVEWARLEPAGESTVSQFIDSLFHNQTSPNGITQFIMNQNCMVYITQSRASQL